MRSFGVLLFLLLFSTTVSTLNEEEVVIEEDPELEVSTKVKKEKLKKEVKSEEKSGASEQSNGGWGTAEKDKVGIEGPCNIQRHDGRELSQEEFINRYAFTEPVIIYNVEQREFQDMTRKQTMLSEWSEKPVVLNSANTYSYARVPSTFGKYIEDKLRPQSLDTLGNETLYLFGDIDQTLWKPLLTSYKLPQWELPGHSPALSFGIAGAGTGVPFHFHGPGFAEVIHGSKRWFLYPFEEKPDFDPDRTTLEWYLKDYKKRVLELVYIADVLKDNYRNPFRLSRDKRPLECLMRPGEVIYFPDKWWHATLNAETAVFISTFLSP